MDYWYIFFGIIWWSQTASAYLFQKQNYTSGVLFTPLTKVQFSYTDWTLIYYYELDEYLNESKRMLENIGKLKHICGQYLLNEDNGKGICEILIDQLEKQHVDMSIDEDMVESYEAKLIRQKRWAGLAYAGLGWLANSAIGYLTRESAENYLERIKILENDVNYQKQLEREQITILEQTINLQKSSMRDMNEYLNNVEHKMDSFWDSFKVLEWGQYFSVLSQVTQTFRDHHKAVTQEILKLLSQTSNGDISRLIPIEVLKNNLLKISEKLKRGIELPIDILRGENIYHIFKICQIKTTLINGTIILEMKIPTVADEVFTLVRATPIPMKTHESTELIQISNEMFCTNPERSVIIPFSQKEYLNCKPTGHERIMCRHSAPKYHKEYKTCELDLLKTENVTELPETCSTVAIKNQNYIIELQVQNKYYIHIQEPIRISEVCDSNEAMETTLTKSGILTMEGSCTIHNDQFILQSRTHYMEKGEVIKIPRINITSDFKSSLDKINKINTNNHQFIQDSLARVDRIKERIDANKGALQYVRPTSWNVKEVVLVLLSISSWFITMVWVGLKVYRKIKARRTNANAVERDQLRVAVEQPIPLPRLGEGIYARPTVRIRCDTPFMGSRSGGRN